MRVLAIILTFAFAMAFTSCDSSEKSDSKKKENTKVEKKTPEKKAPEKKEPEKKEPEKKEPEKKAPAIDKAKLKDVFIKVYCAQKKGETSKVDELYTAAGFEKPAAFSKQWKKASADVKWVEEVFTEAAKSCK